MTHGLATRNTDASNQVDMPASYPSVTMCALNFSFSDRFYISAPPLVGPSVSSASANFHGTLQIFASALKIDFN